jgi:hypothetical protein
VSELADETFISLYGGEPPSSVDGLNVPLHVVRDFEIVFGNIATEVARIIAVNAIRVRFSPGTGVCARVHPLDHEQYLIILPVGMFSRMYAFTRRIWGYLNRAKKGINEKSLLILGTSPADEYDENTFFVPRCVRCIFDEYEQTQAFWADLAEFDAANDHDETTDFNVSIIVAQALLMVFAHELSHVTLRQNFFLRNVIDGMGLAAEAQNLLRTGSELEADFSAGVQLAKIWYDDAERRLALTNEDCFSDFFRMGFSIYLLLSTFDPRKRSLSAYDRATYPHPIVRHHAIRMGVRHWLGQQSTSLLPIWDLGSVGGWLQAGQAVNFFTVLEVCGAAGAESFEGKTPLIPVHSLNYAGEASMPYIKSHVRKGERIFEATRALREKYLGGAITSADFEQVAHLAAELSKKGTEAASPS